MNERLLSLVGVVGLIVLAVLCSSYRSRIRWRIVVFALALQAVIAVVLFQLPLGVKIFDGLNQGIVALVTAGSAGARFLFGPLAVGPGQEGSVGFILAFQAFPSIIFFAALMQVLYYYQILPKVIRGLATLFRRSMGVSGVESLCGASSIFVGIESLTAIRPYLKQATASELCTILTLGMATIASSMLGFYVIVLQGALPYIAGHLVTASLLSAPAALMFAKVLVPEREETALHQQSRMGLFDNEANLFEAIVHGAQAGGKLVVGIAVLLIAVLGLVEVLNLLLSYSSQGISHLTGWVVPQSIQEILAYVFYPLVRLIGVQAGDAWQVAQLLGDRLILTEVKAYQDLAVLIRSQAFQSPRSAVLAAYALCGFAHVASMTIFAGGIIALAPERAALVSRVLPRSLLAATLACLMTAAMAGIFYSNAFNLL